MKGVKFIFLMILFLGLLTNTGFAMNTSKSKTAIVIASFGTTYPEALKSLLNIRKSVEKAFPSVKVKMAFTSNIIRKIWHKRQSDPEWKNRSDIPKDIFFVKGPLATIADLQDEGYKNIIVQSTHVYAGEEFMDLCSYVDGLNAIKTIKKKYMPFEKLVIGRPLLGKWGVEHDYHKDIEIAAKALKKDVEYAKKKRAALVYMGHGNEFFSTGIYIEFQQVMRKLYPDVKIFVGTVEGYPSLEDVVQGVVHSRVKRVVLKPFMVVAGDHARNDMAGDEKDSWKSVLKSKGIKVYPVIEGLGENPDIVSIYVSHIKDVAEENNISLK